MMLMTRAPLFPSSTSTSSTPTPKSRGRAITAPLSSPRSTADTKLTTIASQSIHPKRRIPFRQHAQYQLQQRGRPQRRRQHWEEEEPPPPPPPAPPEYPFTQQQKHRDRAVESFHCKQSLNTLLNKLQRNRGPDSIQKLLVSEVGDLNNEEFWAAIRFLAQNSRFRDVILVFDFWKNVEKSRINEVNYAKLVKLLSESDMMKEATSMVEEMKAYGLTPTVPIYNAIIHGFAVKGELDAVKKFLTEILETGLKPETETYNGLIQAYGNCKMYDEMCKCAKKMAMVDCFPDEDTYNILIRALAQGGLLQKMEQVHHTIRSKKMALQPSTLISILEAYADYGICEKMEMAYHWILNSKIHLEENLVRKMARVYIEGYRFSRLEELAHNTAAKNGRTRLVWYLLLLSSACLMSRKGMECVINEMIVARIRPDVTFINVIGLSYLKMKDFRKLDAVLSQLQNQKLRPDIVSVGVAFDAKMEIDVEIKALDFWRRTGCLAEEVEMRTDPLVLAAFGKGNFLKSCEESYLSLGSIAKHRKLWTYNDLIDLVYNNNRRNPHSPEE